MKMVEVRSKARQMGIKIGRRKKKDLIRAIQLREGNTPCYQKKMVDTCGQFQCCWRDDCF